MSDSTDTTLDVSDIENINNEPLMSKLLDIKSINDEPHFTHLAELYKKLHPSSYFSAHTMDLMSHDVAKYVFKELDESESRWELNIIYQNYMKMPLSCDLLKERKWWDISEIDDLITAYRNDGGLNDRF